MRGAIGREESVLLMRREMADVEDGLEMLQRNRRGIGRIDDLRDEAAVLADRLRQPLPRARGPAVDNRTQDRLVSGKRTRGLRCIRLAHAFSASAARSSARIAALTCGSRAGDTDNARTPVLSSAGMALTSPAASPQIETSTPRARPARTTCAIMARTPGCST